MHASMNYVRMSLELHLFFARIMKEHSFFLETGFTQRDINFIQQADNFRTQFDTLLGEVISISDGAISQEVLQSGEIISPYTLRAEMASSFYTGVQIPTNLTQAEAGLTGGVVMRPNDMLVQAVSSINQRAMSLIAALAQFKSTILSQVLACKMFTNSYPLLIDHIMREAKFYWRMVQKIEARERMNLEAEILEQELFWNRIMAEHSKFIRGLLDPTEDELITTANNFGHEFDQLTAEAKAAIDKSIPILKVTEDSLRATRALRDFKAQGTNGIAECKIRSIIIPLLGDHTLREANHYLRLLKSYRQV
ncbi:DUF2935 domain-containing protein [Dehalobacter sp. DCM]|uniref:DUF2935 domain-containing protein n=1 Tax=Dehalobacter sp. DCM TaxID=2907827 RepID=UPI0030820399|nr:DUF2935 domain-containing protein [Dehalobacter sp. DCM]